MLFDFFKIPPHADMSTGSDEEWEAWEIQTRDRYPIRFFLSWTVPMWCRLRWDQLLDWLWY